MQTLDRTNAADLYWLAFLLTGQREASVGVTIETLDSQQGPHSFFATWMLAWSRKVVISKALGAIREELAESAQRVAALRGGKVAVRSRDWKLDEKASKIQIERALLAIDTLPRCALLLSTFEGASLEDAAILLNADRELVRKAQMIGFQELTHNLAQMQSSPSPAPDVFLTGEMQHA